MRVHARQGTALHARVRVHARQETRLHARVRVHACQGTRLHARVCVHARQGTPLHARSCATQELGALPIHGTLWQHKHQVRYVTCRLEDREAGREIDRRPGERDRHTHAHPRSVFPWLDMVLPCVWGGTAWR
eukprot:357433-Chlamydomonas_euryale.AAC.11